MKELLLLIVFLVHIKTITVPLKDWIFQIGNESQAYKTTIPSTFASDLIKIGLVSQNPYYRDNFLKFY